MHNIEPGYIYLEFSSFILYQSLQLETAFKALINITTIIVSIMELIFN